MQKVKCLLITTLAIAGFQQWKFMFLSAQPVHGVRDQNMNRTCLRLLIVVYTLLHYQRQLSESCTIHFVLWCRIIWRMRPNWKSVPSSNMNLDFESIEWFSNFIAAHKLYFIRKSMYVDVMWNVIGCRSQIFYRRTWQHRFKSLIIRSICSEWYQKHITYNYESSPSANMHTRHLIASVDSTSRAHSRSALFHRIPFKLSMRNFSVFCATAKIKLWWSWRKVNEKIYIQERNKAKRRDAIRHNVLVAF